jgi:TPR repeat protein
MKARRLVALVPFAALGALVVVIGCHRSHADAELARARPVDVASLISSCRTVGDCEQQCSAALPASCVAAGRFYEFGRGVSPDASHAYVLYEHACGLAYSGGCYNAALLLEAGRGVAQDRRAAQDRYMRVCQMGSKTACARAEALGAL